MRSRNGLQTEHFQAAVAAAYPCQISSSIVFETVLGSCAWFWVVWTNLAHLQVQHDPRIARSMSSSGCGSHSRRELCPVLFQEVRGGGQVKLNTLGHVIQTLAGKPAAASDMAESELVNDLVLLCQQLRSSHTSSTQLLLHDARLQQQVQAPKVLFLRFVRLLLCSFRSFR